MAFGRRSRKGRRLGSGVVLLAAMWLGWGALAHGHDPPQLGPAEGPLLSAGPQGWVEWIEGAAPAAPGCGCGGGPGAAPPGQVGPLPRSPRLVVQTDATFVARRLRGGGQALVINTVTGQNELVASSLDFDPELGREVLVAWRKDECWALEFSYCGVPEWRRTDTVVGDNDLAIPGDLGLATFDFFDADIVRVDYSARYDDFEVNYAEPIPHATIMLGFRFIRHADELNIRATDFDTGTSDFSTAATNLVLGPQLGYRIQGGCGRLGWRITCKAGLMANAVSETSFLADFDNTIPLRDSQGSGGDLSGLIDLNVEGTFRLNERFDFRFGGGALYVGALANAPDQIDFTDTPESGTQVTAHGGALLLGAFFGVESRW